MKEITAVEISGNLLILAQPRVKSINIKNAEAEKFLCDLLLCIYTVYLPKGFPASSK